MNSNSRGLSTTRRDFLRRSGALVASNLALPLGLNLAAMGEAAAFQATDYKALVCVFMFGGNDHDSTVVPYDHASYSKYHEIRGGGPGEDDTGIAIAKSRLTANVLQPTTPLADGRVYALHPAMGAMSRLFNSGKAAVLLNVGPLVVPLTRAQYESSDRARYPLPPKLFSHNDQQSVWQTSSPEGSTRGWGGQIADAALANNSEPLVTCLEIMSSMPPALYLTGRQAVNYTMTTQGAVHINALDEGVLSGTAMRSAFSNLIQRPHAHVLANEYNRVTARAIGIEAKINAAQSAVQLTTVFPAGNPLADQLKVVARMIGARGALGAKRQVFFVATGPFDLHDGLVERQPGLIGRVSDAMAAFYDATVEMGLADKVTTFTASDFGRTLSSNGNGSDHGWGGHHFILGGAVKGKAYYGKAPPVSIGDTSAAEDQWHVGQGRLLPTTAVDQYAATLAKWFGVSDAELPTVIPNLHRFGASAGRPDYPTDLGFMV